MMSSNENPPAPFRDMHSCHTTVRNDDTKQSNHYSVNVVVAHEYGISTLQASLSIVEDKRAWNLCLHKYTTMSRTPTKIPVSPIASEVS